MWENGRHWNGSTGDAPGGRHRGGDNLVRPERLPERFEEQQIVRRVSRADNVAALSLPPDKLPVEVDAAEAVLGEPGLDRCGEGGAGRGGRDERGEVDAAAPAADGEERETAGCRKGGDKESAGEEGEGEKVSLGRLKAGKTNSAPAVAAETNCCIAPTVMPGARAMPSAEVRVPA